MATAEASFQTALGTWKDINLVSLQKELDAQGLEIVDNQKENMVGRKRLAEQTREFRRVPDEEKLTEFKTLLKAYQGEIDTITKRSKFAENSFLNLYKLLAEAPDPHPLLEAAIEQTGRLAELPNLEADNKRLREELQKLSSENRDLQSKKTNASKLQAEVSKMEESIAEAVKQRENELNAVNDEKIRNYEEREKNLLSQLEETRTQLKDAKMSNDSTQAKLIDHNQKYDEEVVAKLAELDIVLSDLERANGRVSDMERRNELLREEIETVRSGSESNEKVVLLERQISDQEEEISRLLQNVENYKSQLQTIGTDHNKQITALKRDLATRSEETETLKKKLKQLADYDEIKRELGIMKYVEFRTGSDDEDDGDDESMRLPDPAAKVTNGNQPLEKLLLKKNKRLANDLTGLKVKHDETTGKLEETSRALDNVTSELTKQKALNQRLEDDLLNINKSASHHATSATSNSHHHKSSPSGSAIALNDPLVSLNRNARVDSPARSNSPSVADTSILPIITSQRDRFRQRNAELEDEMRKQFETISDLRGEVQSLQKENLQLYEKARYMQTYKETRGTSLTDVAASPYQVGTAARSDPTAKYQTMYEESMNPFEIFRSREQSRAHGRLNPFERAVLGLVKVVLSNKYLRNVFIVYSLTLHVLVVFTLYELSTLEPEKHAALLPDSVP